MDRCGGRAGVREVGRVTERGVWRGRGLVWRAGVVLVVVVVLLLAVYLRSQFRDDRAEKKG